MNAGRAGSGTAAAPAELALATFWQRYAAWSLDAAAIALLLLPPLWPRLRAAANSFAAAIDAVSARLATLIAEGLLGDQPLPLLARAWLHDPALQAAAAALQRALAALLLPPIAGFVAIALVCALIFERSPWRATPGKRALRLQAVDARGRRLRAGQVLLRFVAGAASWLTLNLGHALAALPPHLALHDRLSDSRVIRSGAATLPWWARAWLSLQLLAFALATAHALRTLHSTMQAAFDRALMP